MRSRPYSARHASSSSGTPFSATGRAEDDPLLGAVRGRVLSPGGSPVVGADVRLTRVDPDLGVQSYTRMRSTLSSHDGRFSFLALESGSYLVDARYQSYWLPTPLRVVIRKEHKEVADVLLTLETAATITGLVTDEETAHGSRLA